MTTTPCDARTFYDTILSKSEFATESIPLTHLLYLMFHFGVEIPHVGMSRTSLMLPFNDGSYLKVLITQVATAPSNELYVWHAETFKDLAEVFKAAQANHSLTTAFADAKPSQLH